MNIPITWLRRASENDNFKNALKIYFLKEERCFNVRNSRFDLSVFVNGKFDFIKTYF